jgi:hypothetical protein
VTARSDDELVLAYEQEMGRSPRNLPEDHPDYWQWSYRGTKEERESLRERLGLPAEEDELPPAVIDGQEELFT